MDRVLKRPMMMCFTDPTVLARKHPLEVNPDIYDRESFAMHEAPKEVQDIWAPYMQH